MGFNEINLLCSTVIDDSLSKAIKETFQKQPLTVVVRTLS